MGEKERVSDFCHFTLHHMRDNEQRKRETKSGKWHLVVASFVSAY
jgi:hypothetical protein